MLAPPKLTGAYGRGTDHRVLIVSIGMVAKQCKSARAVEVVCAQGLGQDALALCRGMFETLVVTAWVLRKRSLERVSVYLAHWAYRKKQ
jgi:hypothetical protein